MPQRTCSFRESMEATRLVRQCSTCVARSLTDDPTMFWGVHGVPLPPLQWRATLGAMHLHGEI